MPADDVEEIDLSGLGEPARDRDTLVARKATIPVLVADEPTADDEIRPDALAHGIEHLERKADSVLDRAAVIVIAAVGGRRPELVEQVAVHLELEPVEARRLAALRRIRIGAADASKVEILGRLGEGAMRGFADG
jgi:hypothetical protein